MPACLHEAPPESPVRHLKPTTLQTTTANRVKTFSSSSALSPCSNNNVSNYQPRQSIYRPIPGATSGYDSYQSNRGYAGGQGYGYGGGGPDRQHGGERGARPPLSGGYGDGRYQGRHDNYQRVSDYQRVRDYKRVRDY